MKIYKMNDEKFKSIYISYNFTIEINDLDLFSQFSVLSAMMAKGSKLYPTQKDIEKYLSSLYGSSFDVNIEKIGDLFNIEFRMELVNKKFIPSKECVLEKCLIFMKEMIYNQLEFTDNNVEREKGFILERINERKDDKLKYGIERAQELLCKGQPFGMYLYGDIESLNKVTKEKLQVCYTKLADAAITVIITGNLSGYDNIDEIINNIFKSNIKSTKRLEQLIYNVKPSVNNEFEEVKEIQDTAQSVLSLGFRIDNDTIHDFYALNIYNAILGTTPSSKLFQNVREKESLAYTVRSRYYRFKSIIVVYAGINKENYEKAMLVIKEQIDDMKSGNISQLEFESAKESLISDLLEWKDSKIALAKMKLSNILVLKDSEIDIEEMIKYISQITLEEVIKVAEKITLEKVFLLGGEDNA